MVVVRVIQCYYGDIPANLIPCIESVKTAYPQVEFFHFSAVDYPIYESDKWRWEMMLNNDDILYVDCDIEIDRRIEFAGDLPSMVFYLGQPDNCLMYSPHRRFFEQYEADRIKRGIAYETPGWYRKVLRDKNIHEIKNIRHLRYSGIDNLIKNYPKGGEHGRGA